MANDELVPVRRGDREIGAYATGPAGRTVFVPAADVTRIATTALAAVTIAAIAVSAALAARRRPAVGAVTMGPGGWISIKGAALPPLRDGAARPWWARLLRSHRLVIRD
jgi:hypothetical protein